MIHSTLPRKRKKFCCQASIEECNKPLQFRSEISSSIAGAAKVFAESHLKMTSLTQRCLMPKSLQTVTYKHLKGQTKIADTINFSLNSGQSDAGTAETSISVSALKSLIRSIEHDAGGKTNWN